MQRLSSIGNGKWCRELCVERSYVVIKVCARDLLGSNGLLNFWRKMRLNRKRRSPLEYELASSLLSTSRSSVMMTQWISALRSRIDTVLKRGPVFEGDS
jgi:hypothetical protein